MEEDTPHKSRTGLWVTLSVLGLVLYVLSIGPVVAFLDRSRPSPAIDQYFEAFYVPVVWLHDHTPLEKPLEKYLDWWTARIR